MDRRSFLVSLTGVALSQGLLGCRAASGSVTQVDVLQGIIPPQINTAFQRYLRKTQQSGSIKFTVASQLDALFTRLQQLQQQSTVTESQNQPFGQLWRTVNSTPSRRLRPDLVTLGDSWLQPAIQQGLIQPFEVNQLEGWDQLTADPWHRLVRRDRRGFLDPQGSIWGLPFRWGSTVLVYRRDIFEQRGLTPPTGWDDLWRSELKHQFSLLDSPRDVIGMTLKRLGQSYNTPNPENVSNLAQQLAALNQQTKFYSSTAYLQPLVLGDTWLAMGWSTDVLNLMQRNANLAAVFPTTGTALWADVWVRPTAQATSLKPVAQEWVDFCWDPAIAAQLATFSRASSPVILTLPPDTLPASLRQNPILLPASDAFKKSEFLYPLTDSSQEAYRRLWQEMRQTT